MRRAALVLVLLLLATPLRSEEGSPFAGWDEKKIESHKKTAKSRIAGKLRRLMTARKGLVFRCSTCQGSGRVRRARGRGTVIVNCVTCSATGGCISEKKFLTVFWDFRTPHYRSSKARRKELEALFERARKDPREAMDFLEQITKWRRKSIDVKGNHAVVTFTEKQDEVEREKTLEWIQADGKWWVAHEEVDAGLSRHDYPAPETPAKKEPPKTSPEPKKGPADPGKADPMKAAPPAKPKKAPEDPEDLFRVTTPTIRHVEENAYKVFGQVTNLTKERRFAYLIVTVSFFEGNRLVETTECNVGAVILKPGKTATYSGFLYADKVPKFDRKVAKISKFEEME